MLSSYVPCFLHARGNLISTYEQCEPSVFKIS